MANWQLGKKDEANKLYYKAVEWMQANRPTDPELMRFRQEAAELLGVELEAKDGKPQSTTPSTGDIGQAD